MAELGKVVPILPIVTKSDSMTIREAATYRREVYRKLQNPQLPEPQGMTAHTSLAARSGCQSFLHTSEWLLVRTKSPVRYVKPKATVSD